MSMSFKASPDGTYGEILVNGQVVAKLPVTGNAVIPGLVGTVSQSGGVPTGAVVERGSNANGDYVRFAAATQICTTTGNIGPVSLSANYSVTKPHPAAFISKPACSFSFASSDSGSIAGYGEIYRNGLGFKSTSSTELIAAGYTYATSISQGITISFLSIGRWF